METAGSLFLPFLAANLFALLALSHLLLGRVLRFVTISPGPGADRLVWLFPLTLLLALLYERAVRGDLYALLRRRLPAGAAAPAVAALGVIVPVWLRLTLLPRPTAPTGVLLSQAALVEIALGLGLAWLALGAGSTLPGGFALAIVWIARFGLQVVSHGGAVPVLEVLGAFAAALSVALVLHGSLAPHRDAVWGG